MGVLGVLIESLRVPFRTGRLAILLAFSFVIPSSLIFITNVFFLRPAYLDFNLKVNDFQTSQKGGGYDELVSGMQKGTRVILGQEAVFFLAGLILSLFTTVATIYASAATYSGGKMTSSKDLFMRIRSAWKRTLITWLCIAVFKLGCLFLLGFSVCYLDPILPQLGTALLIALAILVALPSLLCYLYFDLVWELGLVISVMEEGSQGFSALGKAGELINGKKLQVLLLCLLITITQVAFFWIVGLRTWAF